MDPFTCTLRVTARADRSVARVSVRRQQFEVGRPLEFDEGSPRVSALEYALGAVGAEIVNGVRAAAWRDRLALDAIEALVTGELERTLAYLDVVGEPGSPRIRRIAVRLFVEAPDERAVAGLVADAVARLPLVCTLRTALRLDVDVTVTS